MAALLSPSCTSFSAHHAVVDVPELDARELDHVDLDAPRAQVVEQRFDELVGLVMRKNAP